MKLKAKLATYLKTIDQDSSQLSGKETIQVDSGDVLNLVEKPKKVGNHYEVTIKAYVFAPHWEEIHEPYQQIIRRTEAENFFRRLTDKEYSDLNDCLNTFKITTKNRVLHFLSQVHHESGGLKWLTEIWGPTSAQKGYEGRRDLGNIQSGDGYRFRGGGALQLTGRYNYTKLADYLHDSRILEGADYVAKNYPFSSAGFWWQSNHMNKLCDSGASVREVTKRVNGGYNGLVDRENQFKRASQIFRL